MPAGWVSLTDKWFDDLRAAGRAESTIETRTYQIRHFAVWVGKDPSQVSEDECRRWLGRRNLSQEARRNARAALCGFFQFLAKSKLIESDPTENIPQVKSAQPHPKPCPERGVIKAVRELPPRDSLMVKIGAELGLRRAEIAQIKGTDIIEDVLGQTSLIVNGKGNKQRLVPLTPELAAEISKAGEGWLFPSRNGGGLSHISADRVGKIISPALPKGYSTHSLRHRFATRAYVAGQHDLLAVQQLLGHCSVATTQRYVALPPDALRPIVTACHI